MSKTGNHFYKMKWIYSTGIVFLISIIWLVYQVNVMDSKYSRLINEGSSHLQLIQRLSANSNRGRIILFHAAHCQDTTERKKLILGIRAITQTNSSILDSLYKTNSSLPEQALAVNEAIEIRKKYNQKADEYIRKINLSDKPLIDYSLDEQMEAAFTEYQNSINRLFFTKNGYIQSMNNQLTTETQIKSVLISGFASLPFVIIILLIGILLVEARTLLSTFGS
ncbi:MAG: hypothetical protein JST69_05670 [Bacteroidetes bacterium]|nr:hypothetical protein [Bacteroidota bacterium]